MAFAESIKEWRKITTTKNQIQSWPFIYKPGEHRQQSKEEKNTQNYEPNEFDRMRVKQFLSETVAMHPQYWSRVVRVSATNPIPYAFDAMVGRCRSTMKRLDNLKRYAMYFCYPEFWGKYEGNRRNKLIRESIFIRSTWNNIFFCKKYFVGLHWKALKTIALHTKKTSDSS